MTPRAEVYVRPREPGDVPVPFPPAPDFHQSLERLLWMGRLGTDTRLAVARRGGKVAATAVFERAGDRWFMWKGPAGEPDAEVLATLLGAAPRAATLVLDPAWTLPDALRGGGFTEDGAFSTLLVPAGGGPGAVLARMRGAARRGVKHATAAGLRFECGRSLFSRFYPVYAAAMEAARSPDFASPREMESLLGLAGVRLFAALLEDEVVAGSVCFQHRNALEARYVATDAAYRAVAPLHFVHFKTLEWAAGAGLEFLDLSGLATGEMDAKLANINRFKEGFGGTKYDYPIYVRG